MKKVSGKHQELTEQECNQMILKYEHVIRMLLAKYSIRSDNPQYEDIMQEGRLAILKAIKNYSDDKGASLTTFITVCVERKIISCLRDANTKKNQLNTYAYSIDATSSVKGMNDYISERNDIDDTINRLHYQSIFDEVIKKMSDLEYKVFSMLVIGYPISEISTDLCIPRNQVYVIIGKLRKKIHVLLNDC